MLLYIKAHLKGNKSLYVKIKIELGSGEHCKVRKERPKGGCLCYAPFPPSIDSALIENSCHLANTDIFLLK